MLDVGAGDGTLIDALARRGRDAVGLERDAARPDLRDEPLADVGRGVGGRGVLALAGAPPRPGRRRAPCRRLLAPGGVLVVAVPDAGSLQARVFGDRWLHLDPPRHLVHLTTRALRAGLGGAGLRVERVSRTRGGQVVIGWLDGLVGALPGGLDLYAALRRPEAREARLDRRRRAAAVLAGVVLLPVALAGAAAEVALRRSGTVYVEARRG